VSRCERQSFECPAPEVRRILRRTSGIGRPLKTNSECPAPEVRRILRRTSGIGRPLKPNS
jgi:hypothetical protein